MNAATLRLGDVLVAQGALERVQLEQFIHRMRGRLGCALRRERLVDGPALARAVAHQHDVTRVDLAQTPAAHALFLPRDLPHYIHQHFIPFARDESTVTLATSEPSEALRQFATSHYGGMRVAFVVCSARELAENLAARGATARSRHARLSLRRRQRHLVADRILMRHQWRGCVEFVVALMIFAWFRPHLAWHVVLIGCNAFYMLNLGLKFAFYYKGSLAARALKKQEKRVAAQAAMLHDDELPVYSIMVPMYRESTEVMARLIANIAALDYPHDKLDIKLILEADDLDTLAALKALHPPETMEIIAVPPSQPRTKPKACNVALQHVRGRYLVVYDAEDMPDTDQLKRAVAMFRSGPENLACLQAALNYYNWDERLLTRMFAIEYSALFRLLLPALARMRVPIPLGGTSNHLKTAALLDVGGWDAFNVTEDADLGIRLAYHGYRTKLLPSTTLEESPVAYRAWLKQRTRWIKGYIQTWLVYTRDKKELKRRLGRHGYYGFQFFIGAPALIFLLAPFFWCTFLVSLTGIFPTALSHEMQFICAFSLVGGIGSHWIFARKVLQMEGWRAMGRAFWLYPLYWMLHSVAAARALFQLMTAPHYWDKTLHGTSRIFLVDSAQTGG